MSADYEFPKGRIKPTRWLIQTFMREYERSQGYPPTKRHVATAFGISYNSAHYYSAAQPYSKHGGRR